MVMLGIMAVTGAVADAINLPGIVGAFLAGLAVNGAVEHTSSKEKVGFIGRALFIPCFFIVTGCLIDPIAFAGSIGDHFPLVCGLLGALVLAKGIAALGTGRAFGYPLGARLTMWAMTLPQVAATLAATLVAYNTRNALGERLLDDPDAQHRAGAHGRHVDPGAAPDRAVRAAPRCRERRTETLNNLAVLR